MHASPASRTSGTGDRAERSTIYEGHQNAGPKKEARSSPLSGPLRPRPGGKATHLLSERLAQSAYSLAALVIGELCRARHPEIRGRCKGLRLRFYENGEVKL